MTISEFNNRAAFNGGYDREFSGWKLIDIHQIPDLMTEQHEVDFYCCNDKKVYLLRLRNRKTEMYSKVESDNYPTYLIAELPIKKIDNQLIRTILSHFSID